MLRRSIPLALALLAACASHQKAGDRAGAVGDWRTAEREYAQALRDDPGSAEIRAKYASAREQALTVAVGRARACAGAEDWECAFAEADYAATLDSTSAELALFRRDAARSLGLLRVRKAEDASRRREHGEGLALLAQARGVTDDATVAAQAQRLQPALVRGAVETAEKLRAAGEFPQAIELLALAAEADGGVRPRLEALRAEHGRRLDAEYDRRTAEGDALLAQGRYGDAQAAFEAALQARPGGRAAPLARYAAQMRAGQAAAQSRQWDRAAKAYDAAVRTGVADGGQASQELDRVQVRPYAIQLRSVLIRPARPDGRPWVGERSRVFDAVMIAGHSISAARIGSGDGTALRVALDVANAVPSENRPALVARVDAPGVAGLATPPRRGLHAPLDATVIVAANHYDERALSVRIAHEAGGALHDVGLVSVPLGELVARRGAVLADRSILRLELEVAPSDAAAGTTSGFGPAQAVTRAAPPRR
jgi:tetratricopeptide (TPR) repeat protein